MMEVQSVQHLLELKKAGEGFVFNDTRHSMSYRVWGTLHKASCGWINVMIVNPNWSKKYWFLTFEEARGWIHSQFDREGRKSRLCKTCNPK